MGFRIDEIVRSNDWSIGSRPEKHGARNQVNDDQLFFKSFTRHRHVYEMMTMIIMANSIGLVDPAVYAGSLQNRRERMG